jgi:hypothetical protein
LFALFDILRGKLEGWAGEVVFDVLEVHSACSSNALVMAVNSAIVR